MAISSEKDIIERLINNDSLFNKMFVFHQDFDILPDDKKHYGASIAYQDMSELKDDFLNELSSMKEYITFGEITFKRIDVRLVIIKHKGE